MDMQGFAINARLLLKCSDVWIEMGGAYTNMGYVEASKFIFQFIKNISMLECRTQMNEVGIHISSMYICIQSLLHIEV